ncbi:hypothetical protein CHS0354_012393 [Potamilus streckersoni]|uniref:Uncharacterized protein n=1 Tax=Potamilus streckersoni TaxID=2493646 RepID=A0AAE0RYP4_9BIVA|nr:hypothetical protein CHS0354_012393 [Potamilus streckersoni]
MALDILFIIFGLILNVTAMVNKTSVKNRSSDASSESSKVQATKVSSTVKSSALSTTTMTAIKGSNVTTKRLTSSAEQSKVQTTMLTSSATRSKEQKTKTNSTLKKNKPTNKMKTSAASIFKVSTSKINSAATKSNTKPTSSAHVLMVILLVGLGAHTSIAVVTVLILVCRRRSKEKAKIYKEAPKLQTTEAVVPLNADIHQTYNELEKRTLNQLEESDHDHVSSELVTLKENDPTFSSGTRNLYDVANFNIGDGTYEVTFLANNPRRAVQANLYDHVRLKKTNDGKYDHVDLQDQNNTANEIDTYEQVNIFSF